MCIPRSVCRQVFTLQFNGHAEWPCMGNARPAHSRDVPTQRSLCVSIPRMSSFSLQETIILYSRPYPFLPLSSPPYSQYDHRPPNKKLTSHAERNDYHYIKQDIEAVNQKLSPNLIGFNETQYLLSSHKNDDAYKLNAFNQAESDRLASDRPIPDTRNYKLVLFLCVCVCVCVYMCVLVW